MIIKNLIVYELFNNLCQKYMPEYNALLYIDINVKYLVNYWFFYNTILILLYIK